METEQIPEDRGHKKGRHRKKQLYNSILQQMEFYFSDSNLTKDRFLSQLIEADPNIDISIFLKFNKLRKLTTNIDEIAKAVSKSELIELSEDKTKVCRRVPVKIKQDVDDCTIYVERLKSDATHDWLKSIFSEFGNVVYVSIPKYKHNGIIKGFAFIEFEQAEGAKAAMKYFESINCKISSDLEPQKLCSIATFDPNDKKKDANKCKTQGKCSDVENGQKNSVEMEETNEDTEKIDKSSKGEGDTKMKKKRKHSKSETNEGQDTLDEVQNKKIKIDTCEDFPQKKRKHSETETTEGVAQEAAHGGKKKLKFEGLTKTNDGAREVSSGGKKNLKIEDEAATEEMSNGGNKKLKIENGAKTNESVQQEAMSDVEGEEKKKKKHKKSNRKKINLKEIGLQILSKKDWKKMRNRYLEMQRKTMKQLKMHLNKQRFGNRYGNKKFHTEDQSSEMEVVNESGTPKESDAAKVQSQFISGSIVKVSLSEPCENNKKLKSEFQELSTEIKYVDIPWKIGSEEVFIRFSNNETAKAFCASNFSKGRSCILEGNEEQMYWQKIETSRQEKQKKMVGKQRGRDKLLKKAEKQAAKHMRFDDNNSE